MAAVFAICAIVPILIFSGMSYYRTRAQLEEDAIVALRRDSKAATMAIIERLLIAQQQLTHAGIERAPSAPLISSSAFLHVEPLDPVNSSLSAEEQSRLARGAAVLREVDWQGRLALQLFVPSPDAIMTGSLSPEFLFAPERLAHGESYRITTADRRLLFGVSPGHDGELA